jgi:chromosome segregation ATPase
MSVDDDLRERVEEIVAEETADLRERVDALEEDRDDLRDELAEEREARREAEERVEELEDTVEFLKEGLWNLEDFVLGDTGSALADAIASEEGDLLDRVEEVEATVDATNAVANDEQDFAEDLTPMEQIARLPEHVAAEQFDNENHRNTFRARSLVRDFFDYAKKTPRGHVIKNPDVCRVLTAQEDGRVESKTGERVMSRIEDLSKGAFEHVPPAENRHGEHILILDEPEDFAVADTVVS